MFKRLKRLALQYFGSPSSDVSEALEVIQEHSAALEEITRDLADVHTALQRIERKQLRWLEMFNQKSGVVEEPPGGDNKQSLATLVPGQIVE